MTILRKFVVIGAIAVVLASLGVGLFAYRAYGILQQQLPVQQMHLTKSLLTAPPL